MGIEQSRADATDGSPAEQAANAIRAAIHQARYSPGQRLVENDLVQTLGVGRGPVREALRLLSAQGLVTIERNKGAMVARATKTVVSDVFEMRELLEGLAARRAAAHVAAHGAPEMLVALLEEERLRDTDADPQSLMDANERLHRAIVDVAGSEVLARELQQMQLPELRSLFFRVVSPVVWRASKQEHIALLETILAGQSEQAELAMRAHVRRTADLSASLPDALFA